jgi:hypothetical protein
MALSIAAIAGVLVWILVRPSILAPRYMLADLFLFLIPAAGATEYVTQNENGPYWLSTWIMGCIGITIMTTGLAFYNKVFFPLKTYQFLSGQLSECGRDTEYCEVMVAVNQRAPLGTRLFINSYQRYWLRPDLLQCQWTIEEIQIYVALPTDAERWKYLYERGFRYLIFFRQWGFIFDGIPSLDVRHIPDWLSVTQEQVGLNTILLLETRDSRHETDVVCEQRGSSAWELVSPYFETP